MSSLGIILSNIHNETIDELTRKRTSASIPFGGRYRIIDFTLSNFVNAGISNVGVLTQKNYQSLLDHLGSGKDWDLSRKKGGLIIFPPYSSYRSDFLYENRFEALKSVSGFINKQIEDDVIITDCDNVNVVDYSEVLKFHHDSNADITVVYKKMEATSGVESRMAFDVNKESRVTKAMLRCKKGEISKISLNIWIIKRSLLQGLLSDAPITGTKSFTKDVISANVKSLNIMAYEYKGIFLHMSSMEAYFKSNMALLDENVRNELFGDTNRRIYTKVRDSAPTMYGNDAVVENSFIADGCVIEGVVKNSIIARGVKVAKGAVVENSILMQDTMVGSNCKLNYVITDKNVTILEKNILTGCEKVPYYLGKWMIV